MPDTIVALSTPEGRGAVAVVRLSGPDALAVAGAVFRAKSGKPPTKMTGYTAAYGRFFFGEEPIDEGVALVFRAPKSYTGEDMAELTCHGNPLLARRLVAACVAAGASPAGGGEFTRRAFENGKLDLSAAEAVAELIAAESAAAARAALERREGAVSRAVDALRDALVGEAARLAVWSDYPEEEDAPAVTPGGLRAALAAAQSELKRLISGHRAARMTQQGVSVAIVGSPNVGKSTLMNLLAGEGRSIVTDVAGTTRDVVEGTALLPPEGIALRLLDTAGIRETDDVVEKIGVSRAREALEYADVALLVLDGSRPLGADDDKLLEDLRRREGGRPVVVALNKSDLPPVLFPRDVGRCVEISAATGEGGTALRDALRDALRLGSGGGLVASQRQFDCLLRSSAALGEAVRALDAGVTLDAVGVLLDESVAPLAELTGRSAAETVIDKVFSSFCVGK